MPVKLIDANDTQLISTHVRNPRCISDQAITSSKLIYLIDDANYCLALTGHNGFFTHYHEHIFFEDFKEAEKAFNTAFWSVMSGGKVASMFVTIQNFHDAIFRHDWANSKYCDSQAL